MGRGEVESGGEKGIGKEGDLNNTGHGGKRRGEQREETQLLCDLCASRSGYQRITTRLACLQVVPSLKNHVGKRANHKGRPLPTAKTRNKEKKEGREKMMGNPLWIKRS